MSYSTDRFPQGVPISQCGLIREALIAETVAINSYQTSLAYSDIPKLNAFLLELMGDEIHHYNLLTRYLNTIDKEQAMFFKEIQKQDFNVDFKQNPLDSKTQTTYSILSQLRNNLKGEFEAIILYDELESKLKDIHGKALIHAIAKDEKEHVSELDTIISNIMELPKVLS